MYKNLKLEPAEGGFILTYDLYKKSSNDDYDGMRYVCEKKEVFEYPQEAIERLMELHAEGYKPENKEYPSKMPRRGDESPNLSSEGMDSALGGA